MPTDHMSRAKELVELLNERDELEARLKTVKERAGDLQGHLLEAMEAEEFPCPARVAGRTLFIKRTLWAGVAQGSSKPEVCEALREADLEDYVSETFNTNSLSAYVRDVARENKKGDLDLTPEEVIGLLPEPLRARVKVSEKVELGHRSA